MKKDKTVPPMNEQIAKSNELAGLLMDANNEIMQLRRQNELLRAKVEVFDSLMCLLHSKPAERNESAAVDVAWQLRSFLERVQTGAVELKESQ